MTIETLFFGGNWANTYLLTDGRGVSAVVDPGAPTPRLLEALDGRNVKYILLTHGHFDHITGAPAVKEQTGAEILIHRDDAPMTEDPAKSLALAALGRGQTPFSADRLLDDGQTLPFGDIRVLHTPGHTPGSVCYLCEDIIISGDTLFAGGIGRTDFPGGDLGEMKRSLRKLLALPGDFTVYPGHGEATTLENERVNNDHIHFLVH